MGRVLAVYTWGSEFGSSTSVRKMAWWWPAYNSHIGCLAQVDAETLGPVILTKSASIRFYDSFSKTKVEMTKERHTLVSGGSRESVCVLRGVM